MLQGWIQITLTLLIVLAITPFFGRYMARVYQQQRTFLSSILNPVERSLYSLVGVSGKENMTGLAVCTGNPVQQRCDGVADPLYYPESRMASPQPD